MHLRVPDPAAASVEPVHKDVTRTKVVQLTYGGTSALQLRRDSCINGGQSSSFNVLPHADRWVDALAHIPDQPGEEVALTVYVVIPARVNHTGVDCRSNRIIRRRSLSSSKTRFFVKRWNDTYRAVCRTPEHRGVKRIADKFTISTKQQHLHKSRCAI